jgi:hypothetical protein
MLHPNLRLGVRSGAFLFAFSTKILYPFLFLPVRDLGPAHFILFCLIVMLFGALNITKIKIMKLSQAPSSFFPPKLKYLPYYTGRFIMYSRITKIYYGKTVGHVFTKPVQIEGTTHFFPSKLFFIVVHISAARRCECM